MTDSLSRHNIRSIRQRDFPSLIYKCACCGRCQSAVVHLNDWKRFEISFEKATALRMMGVPFREDVCERCLDILGKGRCPKCGREIHD